MIKIGITSSTRSDNSNLYNTLGNDYINSIIKCGGCPVIIPAVKEKFIITDYINMIDGIIFSGGEDISPGLYNEKNAGLTENINPLRDKMEFSAIEAALNKKIPILGICRGMQILNVFFGGNLFQDISSQHHSEIKHANILKIRSELHHDITVNEKTHLMKVTGLNTIQVNSRHHQGIKNPAGNFTISAMASDGIIEAIEDINNDIVAIQWHPENIADTEKSSAAIINNLLQRASQR